MRSALDGYLLGSYANLSVHAWQRLASEAKSSGIALHIIGVHDCHVSNGTAYHNGNPLPHRAFAINRYRSGQINQFLNRCCNRCYNPYAAHSIYINKFEQMESLDSGEFIKPGYLLATARLSAEVLAQRLGYPFVAKGLESSQGKEVFLIKHQGDLSNLQTRFPPDKEWLFQEFIPESAGRDMRFFVVRGTIVAGIVRTAQEDFRANVCLGSTVEALNPSPAIDRIAHDLWHQSNLDFFGLDLLFGAEKPYFCEINTMAGFEGIETATGINVAKKIIDTILSDHKQDPDGFSAKKPHDPIVSDPDPKGQKPPTSDDTL
jgi:RimK family alpha-L-glutamate ligase